MGWWWNSQSDFVLELGLTSCQPQADLIPASCRPHANFGQTLCQPWADLMPTLGSPCGNLVQTSCQPQADLMPTLGRPHANLMQTSCQPQADLMQTSCQPQANLRQTLAKPRKVVLEEFNIYFMRSSCNIWWHHFATFDNIICMDLDDLHILLWILKSWKDKQM